jgi:N-acetylglucosamine-6-sulfatase
MIQTFRSGILVVFVLATCAHADDRPNVLFIMSDDHCSQAVGAYGGRLAALNPTPTIDRLAREGMLFENAFCTNSICSPSRACILTGQYAHTNGAYDLGGRVETERQYLALEMKKAGYDTAMIGKWHLKEEPGAFDYYCVLPGQGKYFDPEFRVRGEKPWPNSTIKFDGAHSTDAITDLTLSWLKENWDQKKPFFLMHHYKAPHDFFEFAPRYKDYLEETQIPEPANLWEQPGFGSIATRGADDELLPYIGTSIGRRNPRRNYTQKWAQDPRLTDEQATRQAYNEYMRWYLRCVKGVDDNLARLFGYLEETGQMDNTVIIYTGDQGFMLGEHDYMDKRWMYEESMRMPFLVRYPKLVPAGSRTDAIVENVDYGPTMLAFAGVQTPDHMQGRSFHEICVSGKEPGDWKQAAYYRYWMHMAHHDNPGHVGIRTKEYKLIFYYGCNYEGENQTPPGWELYDLQDDPTEVVNLYANPVYADVVSDLKKRLAELRRQVGDTGEDYPQVEAIIAEFWDYDAADREKAVEISHAYLSAKQKPARKSVRARTTKSGWILPAESSEPLRKHEGASEISRDATYRIVGRGPDAYNVDNAYLHSGDPPPVKQHAFHTAEADQPCVVVQLKKPSSIVHVQIVNRLTGDTTLLDRAAGLTMWLSDDGEQWKQVWQADEVQPRWTVSLDDAQVCRFIKVGLPRTGTLHLNQIVVFGESSRFE